MPLLPPARLTHVESHLELQPRRGSDATAILGPMSTSSPSERDKPSQAAEDDVILSDDLNDVDWGELKRNLAADDFDNGRSPEQLARSCANSFAAIFALDGPKVVGMGRLLSDQVCNGYLVDVWTMSTYRRRGIGARVVKALLNRVPGQHVILQTDIEAAFYSDLGFRKRDGLMEIVVGTWLKTGEG